MNVSLIVINIEVILWDSCQFKGYNGITQGMPVSGLPCVCVCVCVFNTYIIVSFTDINHVYLQNKFTDSIKYTVVFPTNPI